MSPRDLDFMEAKNSAAREIALAIGVPPMLLGIPASIDPHPRPALAPGVVVSTARPNSNRIPA